MLVSKELGGAGLIALQLASDFGRVRPSLVWLPGEGAAAAKAEEMGLSYRTYDPPRAFTSSRIQATLYNLRLGRLLRQLRPGLIHIHSPSHYGALSLGFRISGLKTVVHVHLEEKQEDLRWAFKRRPDVIITCARFLVDDVRNALPEIWQERQLIVPVPNAVDTERFQPGDKVAAKVRVGALPGHILILMVANLAPHKGQETAIKMAAQLKKKGLAAQLWLAGTERDGRLEYTNRLRTIIKERGLGDVVRLLGQRTNISDLLRAADVFVLPSTSEGLPLSILEAQACKVPVLATPIAGIPETISHGRTGFLINASDAESYASHIVALIHDPGLYAKITEAAYRKVLDDYSWKTFLTRTEEVYRQILTGKPC